MNTSQIFLIYRTKETKSKNKKTIAFHILYYKTNKKTSKIIKNTSIYLKKHQCKIKRSAL
ncbi:hypothetical protein HMPREF2738_02889 [Clostridiales bacterium KLE1615]|nr:hypothetical protein HMPREF2738_02889 [Clostridiales bacterium KLE1615]